MRLCGLKNHFSVTAGAGSRQFGQDFEAMFGALQKLTEKYHRTVFYATAGRTREKFLKWAENHPSLYVVEQGYGNFKLVDCWGL